jgi:RNA polymerase sigma-70 factor (ECF subfamily)
MSVASRAMRQVLVDRARAQAAGKRGWGAHKLRIDEVLVLAGRRSEEILALDIALDRLKALDSRQCRAVELHHFAGLSIEEVADVLDVSPTTVKRDLKTARAWLSRELGGKT